MGTQQSGMLELKIADIMKDNAILQYARQLAHALLEEDRELAPKNKAILSHYKEICNKQLKWSRCHLMSYNTSFFFLFLL